MAQWRKASSASEPLFCFVLLFPSSAFARLAAPAQARRCALGAPSARGLRACERGALRSPWN
eukprot:15184256-Alexandrium_andersonii.AAC.1